MDITTVLNGYDITDTYSEDFQQRRMIIYTLHFTMKGFFFGPPKQQKVIKIAFADFYTSIDATKSETGITTQPGLTDSGQPTTDITETIPYLQIDEEDNWGVIVTLRDEPR